MIAYRHLLLQAVDRAREHSAAWQNDGPSASWRREKARLDSVQRQPRREAISGALLAETVQPADARSPGGYAA